MPQRAPPVPAVVVPVPGDRHPPEVDVLPAGLTVIGTCEEQAGWQAWTLTVPDEVTVAGV